MTGEIFVTDEDVKEYENEMREKRNYRELKIFFENLSSKQKK